MKVVINKCYGGFSLSPLAVREWAKLKGRDCYLFKTEYGGKKEKYVPLTEEQIQTSGKRDHLFFCAFDIPNPETLHYEGEWYELSKEERISFNETWRGNSIEIRPEDRADPDLVKIVEMLGERADGACAKLKIVEIPDGTEYEIDEYDGMESIHEVHQSWG